MATEGAPEQTVDQNAGGTSTTAGSQTAGDQKTNQQTTTQQTTAAASAGTEDWEKRFKGVTTDLQKERKRAQAAEARAKQHEAELAAERARIQALVGVTPQDPTESENAQIRKRLGEVLGVELTKEDIEAIRELRARKADLEETTKHYWSQHSKTMVDGVQSEIEKSLGGKLTDRQRQKVERLYALEAENNEEFLERHSRGDKSLIKEFAEQFIEDFFEPARRSVVKQQTERFRPVPSGKDRGIVTHGERKIDVTDDKAVGDFLGRGFRERMNRA